jgi:hypothetical protein
MVLLIAIGAAFAAHVAVEKGKEAASIDPEIHLEGKKACSLLPMERELSVLELPIATVSFFDGSYKDAVADLSSRVDEILDKNPWLGGWLCRDKADGFQLKLYYDPTGDDRCSGHFEAFEPFVIPLGREKTPYKDYGKIIGAMGATIPNNEDLVGKNKPLWKVSVIPDADRPDDRFALVVSMSHILGDAQTYYKIFGMLDQGAKIEELNPDRPDNFQEATEEKLGKREANYLRDAVSHPAIDFSKSDDRNVVKMFYVDEDWILARKGRRASVFGGDSMSTVVSANSILSSWFFKVNEASVGLIVVNLRNRLDCCPVGDWNAGNYIQTLSYTPIDYSTPGKIQLSLASLRRCGSDPPADLPAFRWNMTSSISVSWSNFFREEISLHDDITQQLHLPVFDVESLKTLPDRVSYINVFTACPSGINGSERRAGAFVVCRESVWSTIKECGIVEAMIADI